MRGEFSYQSIVVDGVTETHTDGETSSTCTLTSVGAGRQIKERVNFAHDAGGEPAGHERGDACRGGGGGRRAGVGQDRLRPLHAAARRRQGFAGNDWNLDVGKRTHQAKFKVVNATATLNVGLAPCFRSLGFPNTATLSGRLTARLGAWRRADGVCRVMGTCATAWCGYTCSPRAPRWSAPRRLWIISTHIVRLRTQCYVSRRARTP